MGRRLRRHRLNHGVAGGSMSESRSDGITAAAAEAVRKAGTPSEAALTKVARVLATLSEDC